MRNANGQFIKGYCASPATQFQPGQHWRAPQPFREKQYLETEYINKQRSIGDIAKEFDCTEPAVRFWIRRHNIPTRNVSQARKVKRWGLSGSANGMYGRNGHLNPHWKGGITPERQSFYNSPEWKRAVAQVWRREDGYCQRCNLDYRTVDHKTQRFHIHHIIPFVVKELRAETYNLALLCRPCHNFIHSKANIVYLFLALPLSNEKVEIVS